MEGSGITAPFAVFDVETTGFAATGADRVIEIAIVQADHRGEIVDEWSTLLHPDRDPGPTWVHGISLELLLGAPHFEDVAGDIAERMEGRTLVGHNISFDLRFLAAEFERIGHPLPRIPAACTMRMSRLLGKQAPRKLADCCDHFGVELINAHSALDDARATARLFGACLTAGCPLDETIRTHDGIAPGVRWPALQASGIAYPRG